MSKSILSISIEKIDPFSSLAHIDSAFLQIMIMNS